MVVVMKKLLIKSYIVVLLSFLIFVVIDTSRIILQLVNANSKFKADTVWGLYIESFGKESDSNIIIKMDYEQLILILLVAIGIVSIIVSVVKYLKKGEKLGHEV